jgi:tRNA (mo5U34)-methyltransferase
MDAHELEQRIASFPRWGYRFEFDNGVRTPALDPSLVNRSEQRRRYFFDRLLGLMGGSLRGHRVLDLGCNAGFWSLAAIEAEADFVLGVDGQQTYIDQAKLVFEEKGIDPARYRFDLGNVFERDFAESFDVVLCLGLMDHVSRPVELFELMARAGAKSIVIDTEISRARSSLFEVSSLYQTRDVVEHPLVLIPSRQAVVDLAGEFGFSTVPLALNITDYSGMQDYRRKRRLAFICSKSLPVSGLPTEKDAPIIPWWVRDPRALLDAYR